MTEDAQFVERRATSLLACPGYIDDVAHWLIKLARIKGGERTIECVYEGVILHVRESSTVASVRSYLYRQHAARIGLRAPAQA